MIQKKAPSGTLFISMWILALILFFSGCSHKTDIGILSRQSSFSIPSELQSPWIQNGCVLFQLRQEPKFYPGNKCIFLSDGSFLSASYTSLRRFSPALEVLWELPGHYHHQLNLSQDGSKILTLSSDIFSKDKKTFVEDIFLVISLDGKLLHRRGALSVLSEKDVPLLAGSPINSKIVFLKAAGEISHFNSIYDIPHNLYQNKYAWMKEGNVIVNGNGHGIFILSPDLSRVLYYLDYPHSMSLSLGSLMLKSNLHDVQVTPEGEFLVFNNRVNDASSFYSSVEKFDPVKNEITWRFTAFPKEMFFSPACGGVQEIGDLIFFSHITAGGFAYSKKENAIVKFFPGNNGSVRGLNPTQQLKLPDPKVIQSFFEKQK